VHPVSHVTGHFSAAPSLEQRLPALVLINLQVRDLPLNTNDSSLSWQYELPVVGEVTGAFVGGDVKVAFVGAGVTGVLLVGGDVTVAFVGAGVTGVLLVGGDVKVAFVGAGVTGVLLVGGDVTVAFVGAGVTGVLLVGGDVTVAFVGAGVTGVLVDAGVTGVLVGAGVETSQLSVACPVAYTKIRAVPGEPVSREQTLTVRVPEPDLL